MNALRVNHLALLLTLTAAQILFQLATVAAATAPNHFLGTCLDEAWVKQIEDKLSISRYQRDARGRLVHPHLHAALKVPRFKVTDPRTAFATSQLYRDDCKPANSVIYGADAILDDLGKVMDPGRVNGTLVVELKSRESAKLTTMVFSIITQELFGYEVSFFRVNENELMAQRMSSVGAGLCTPVHVNMEVKTDIDAIKKYAIYSNESYSSGSIGYSGRSGLYTTVDFINSGVDLTKNSPTFAADFWRDYQSNEQLISKLPVSALTSNAKYYPPAQVACEDGTLGCKDSCSKTAACYKREKESKACLLISMISAAAEPAYIQAVLENNDIPATFCFLGYTQLVAYALEAQQSGKPVVFHHFEPDTFHIEFDGLFERVMLPRSTPEKSLLNTGTFGEHANGVKTDNPVRVDFPISSFQKYSATLTQDLTLINSLISRMGFNEIELSELMKISVDLAKASPPVPDVMFTSACNWLRTNYQVWSLWLGRLPACDVYYYIAHDYDGCNGTTTVSFPRVVRSRWLYPNPENSSMPHNCDGGILTPPAPLTTSKSCEWLMANRLIWIFWISIGKPACDPTFYTYNVSACDRTSSKREAQYHWKIPDPSNSSLSAECKGGIPLPASVLLECDYVPKSDPRFTMVAAIALVLSAIFSIAMVFVFWNRKQPIIKRSQYQFLLVLLFGGILVCGAVWSYAGAPTDMLCSTRASGIAYGFTLIFGSLVVKTLRVYRVFLSGAMKRVVLSTRTMFKILGVFLLIDFVIIVTWVIVDPPMATLVDEKMPEIGGGLVERLRCTSSSFIFTALLIFWKAVLLFTGLYLSFLIRKVSSDFQESIWIFASGLVVLFTSVVILALAYLVELPAIKFYLFFSLLLLASTATVMGLMIIPKIVRLHDRATDSTATSTTSAGGDSRGSGNSASSGNSTSDKGNMEGIVPGFRPTSDLKKKKSKPSKVQVTPVQQFTSNDDS